jgi:hypothetical protein
MIDYSKRAVSEYRPFTVIGDLYIEMYGIRGKLFEGV